MKRDTVTRRDTTVRDTTARDTVPRDTLHLHHDSTAADSAHVKRDTLKAPLARAEMPPSADVGWPYHWDRAALFATGAHTLGELLERIPGATTYRSGWLASPEQTAYLGDFARVRIYYDGLELEPLDPNGGGLLDLGEVQLWTLEEVAVERGADEMRVYVRSWRVDRTTPNSRTDAETGDQDINVYRGFLGKRFNHGEAVQLAAQQYGYSNSFPAFGGGDQLAAFVRVGWARGKLSLDATGLRGSRTRDEQQRFFGGATIPQLRAKRTDAYLRAAWSDPDRNGVWAQAIAASEHWSQSATATVGRPSTAPEPVTHLQFIGAGGVTWGPLRLSATNRTRTFDVGTRNGFRRSAVEGRASFETRWLSLSARAEQRQSDSSSVEELSARLEPLSWLALGGAVARRHGGTADFGEHRSARGEVGIRVHQMWLTGGVLLRDTTTLAAPIVFDSTFVIGTETERSMGGFAAASGKFWKDLYLDASFVHWQKPSEYRPQTQLRAVMGVNTEWRSRFPSGDFGFHFESGVNRRSIVYFPTNTDALVTSTGHLVLETLVEIRLLDAVIFYQNRTRIRPVNFDIVPGFVFPRQTNLYGVRWQFWN